MKHNIKSETAYKTIGEIAKKLNLVNEKTGRLMTHTIRYWESQFKQIKPTIRAGRRRYYSKKDFEVIKYIKFLLKEKGFTINGVKSLLNENKPHLLDDVNKLGIYNQSSEKRKIIKEKVKKISKLVKYIKNYK
tara:strand:- start:382 stop:780 length:399 start_codon:yes stop_codon:yes gene_type:complete